MSWVMVGSTAISAGASVYGSQQAANAQSDAAKKNAALQQQNMLMQLGLSEPNRALGYGAMSDLASLYGYSLPGYRTNSELMNPYLNGSTVKVDGRNSRTDYLNPGGAFGLGGNKDKVFGGSINPLTGTVDIANGNGKKAQRLEAELTNYLRTGEGDFGKKANRFVKEIDKMRAAGWEYDPNAASADKNFNPAGSGQAGNMSRFFTSPDYQFRLQEGQRNIGNSFAARGGAASGNALRALTDYNQGQASGEYANYVNRLFNMAGIGQAGTNAASNAGNNFTNGMSQSNQQMGDARASGVMGAANGVTGAINSGINGWLMNRYLNQSGGAGVPAGAPSQFGPYSGGYQLPQQPKQQWNYMDSLGSI